MTSRHSEIGSCLPGLPSNDLKLKAIQSNHQRRPNQPENNSTSFNQVERPKTTSKSIRNANLTRLDFLPKGLLELDASNNKLSFLSSFATRLNDIEWLDLSFNRIVSLKGLENCSKLRSVNLSHNFLGDHETTAVTSLPMLEAIDVSYNYIRDPETPNKIVKTLNKLQELICQGNELESFSIRSSGRQFRRLDVSRNEIKSLEINGVSFLKELDLQFNKISKIDWVSGRLESLEDLKMQNNLIKEVQDIPLELISGVIRLSLRGNLIRFAEIQGLMKVKDIDLGENQISSLKFSGLESVERVFLDGNRLKEANGSDLEIDGATSEALREIHFEGNPLRELEMECNEEGEPGQVVIHQKKWGIFPNATVFLGFEKEEKEFKVKKGGWEMEKKREEREKEEKKRQFDSLNSKEEERGFGHLSLKESESEPYQKEQLNETFSLDSSLFKSLSSPEGETTPRKRSQKENGSSEQFGARRAPEKLELNLKALRLPPAYPNSGLNTSSRSLFSSSNCSSRQTKPKAISSLRRNLEYLNASIAKMDEKLQNDSNSKSSSEENEGNKQGIMLNRHERKKSRDGKVNELPIRCFLQNRKPEQLWLFQAKQDPAESSSNSKRIRDLLSASFKQFTGLNQYAFVPLIPVKRRGIQAGIREKSISKEIVPESLEYQMASGLLGLENFRLRRMIKTTFPLGFSSFLEKNKENMEQIISFESNSVIFFQFSSLMCHPNHMKVLSCFHRSPEAFKNEKALVFSGDISSCLKTKTDNELSIWRMSLHLVSLGKCKVEKEVKVAEIIEDDSRLNELRRYFRLLVALLRSAFNGNRREFDSVYLVQEHVFVVFNTANALPIYLMEFQLPEILQRAPTHCQANL